MSVFFTTAHHLFFDTTILCWTLNLIEMKNLLLLSRHRLSTLFPFTQSNAVTSLKFIFLLNYIVRSICVHSQWHGSAVEVKLYEGKCLFSTLNWDFLQRFPERSYHVFISIKKSLLSKLAKSFNLKRISPSVHTYTSKYYYSSFVLITEHQRYLTQPFFFKAISAARWMRGIEGRARWAWATGK